MHKGPCSVQFPHSWYVDQARQGTCRLKSELEKEKQQLRQQLGLLLGELLYSLLLFSKNILVPSVPLPRMSPLLEYLSLFSCIITNVHSLVSIFLPIGS